MRRLTNWLPHLLLFPYVLAHALVALMDRDGKVWPVVTGQVVNWAGWSASGDLALHVDGQIWLVWVS